MSKQGYLVTVLPDAIKQVRKLPKKVRQNIDTRIAELGIDPQPQMAIPLKGMMAIWRLRVGNHRIIYRLDHAARVVTVLYVERRREDTYRGF